MNKKEFEKLIQENHILQKKYFHAMYEYARLLELFYWNMTIDGTRNDYRCCVIKNGKPQIIKFRCKSHYERSKRLKEFFKQAWKEEQSK